MGADYRKNSGTIPASIYMVVRHGGMEPVFVAGYGRPDGLYKGDAVSIRSGLDESADSIFVCLLCGAAIGGVIGKLVMDEEGGCPLPAGRNNPAGGRRDFVCGSIVCRKSRLFGKFVLQSVFIFPVLVSRLAGGIDEKHTVDKNNFILPAAV